MSMYYVVADSYKDKEEWVKALPHSFPNGGKLLRDARNTVAVYDGRNLVVKRFKRVAIIQAIAYTFFRPTKARRAYYYAERLLSLGIATPKPVAFIEIKEGMLFRRGFFISEYSSDADLLCLEQMTTSERKPYVDAFVGFMLRLHKAGFMHGDSNLTNFMYHRENDGTLSFSTIDINRSHFLSSEPSHKQCLHNLVRLTHNRELLKEIVGAYALLRGWNEKESFDFVMSKLSFFETKLSIKRMFKKALGIQKH